jgi:hypothetical protein
MSHRLVIRYIRFSFLLALMLRGWSVVIRCLNNWICKNLWICLVVILAPSVVKSASLKAIDPFALYPKNIIFKVLRNDVIIGKHQVFFSRLKNDDVGVVVRLNLQINFLSFPIYKFDYKSNAVWHNMKLKSLLAEQNDNGEKIVVKVSRQNTILKIINQDSKFQTHGNTFPTNHWNPQVVMADKVINTLTGEPSLVVIKNLGKEKIMAQDDPIFATKYKYTGDINALVWYSDKGNWVKMQFEGKDGVGIDYVCVECGLEYEIKEGVKH